MKRKEKMIIPFVGLKEGMHQFEFRADASFFEQFEYSIIEEASIAIRVDFEKKSTLFNLHFALDGDLIFPCDRCLDPISLHVKGEEDLIVKFGEEAYEETDDILIIPHQAYELDLSHIVYEYAHLMLPEKRVHEDIADCNQEVIRKLEELSEKREEGGTDPRWNALMNLK